jgi:hypothetical protein
MMNDRIEREEAGVPDTEGKCVPTASRTLVIVTSQVAVIVVLVVLWSRLRRRGAVE